MPTTISGSTGLNLIGSGNQVTFSDSSIQNTTPKTGFVNRIINGGMTIDQRNAGASVTPTDGQYLVDRWVAGLTQASKFSAQQNAGAVIPPNGFINYLGATSLSAYSITSGDFFGLSQKVEGLNVADLGWGTANAQSVTLSFLVRSSLTGTFGGSLINSAGNRSYPFSYTISSASTWEYKTITIAGDTTGTWLTSNGVGVRLTFSIGMGSTFSGTAGAWAAAGYYSCTGATSVVGTSGATFFVTGCQLEKGSTATPFEFRSIGTELALCQRYFQKQNISIGEQYAAFSSNIPAATRVTFPVTMRVTPTVVLTNISQLLTNSSFANFISVDGFSYQVNVTATGTYSRQDVASMNGAEL